MGNSRTRQCIVGVGSTAYTKRSGRSVYDLAIEACLAALDDAGMDPAEVDGVIPYPGGVSAEEIMGALALPNMQFTAQIAMGGASMVASIRLASLVLAARGANNVLVVVARNGSSGTRVADRVRDLPALWLREQLEFPFGWSTPAQWYATICRRHMYAHGTTKAELAAVALTMRAHAQLNPQAMMCGRPLTAQEYAAAPIIADPYQKFDCSLETDGAAAILLTTAARARHTRRRPVSVAGAAIGYPDSPDDLTNRRDWMRIGLSTAAPKAFAMAGVTPNDIDVAMIYDCFTFEVIHQLEEAGFCPRGEGGPFVADGHIARDGTLPVNTHGGLLSEAHMLGLNHVIEAVRQLRGECGSRQLNNPRLAAVTGWGTLGDGSMAILRAED